MEKPWPRHSRLGLVREGFRLEVRLCLKDELETAQGKGHSRQRKWELETLEDMLNDTD